MQYLRHKIRNYHCILKLVQIHFYPSNLKATRGGGAICHNNNVQRTTTFLHIFNNNTHIFFLLHRCFMWSLFFLFLLLYLGMPGDHHCLLLVFHSLSFNKISTYLMVINTVCHSEIYFSLQEDAMDVRFAVLSVNHMRGCHTTDFLCYFVIKQMQFKFSLSASKQKETTIWGRSSSWGHPSPHVKHVLCLQPVQMSYPLVKRL